MRTDIAVSNVTRTGTSSAVAEFTLDLAGIRLRRCRLVKADGRLTFALPAAVPAGVGMIVDNGLRHVVAKAVRAELEKVEGA